MKKLLSLLFVVFAMMPCLAAQIDVKVNRSTQFPGRRAPSAVQVSAFYENGIVTVDVSRYYGEAQVFVYDANGVIVGTSCITVLGSDNIICNMDSSAKGEYTLSIVLDNAEYMGTFCVEEQLYFIE